MKYYEKLRIDSIKKYYPIELQIEYNNIKGTFFRKENENVFLAYEPINDSKTEFIIYFFKSENEKDGNKLIDDFNERDITFRVDDIKILDILLIANSLEYTIKDSDYDDIDKLFPLEEN